MLISGSARRQGCFSAEYASRYCNGEALMAAARDHAARILRPEPDGTEGDAARDASAGLANQLRNHISEEARRHAETPDRPAIDKPPTDKPAAAPAAAAAAVSAAPKSGKRRVVLVGIL